MKYQYEQSLIRDDDIPCGICNVSWIHCNRSTPVAKIKNGVWFYETSLGTLCYECIEKLEKTDPVFAIGLGATLD